MLLATISLLLVLCLISYAIFKRDILSPPVVVSMGLFFGSLCTYYNAETWGLEFSSSTMTTIVSGVGVFILGGLLASVPMKAFNRHMKGYTALTRSVKPIFIHNYKTCIVISLELITIAMVYLEMRRIMGSGESWSKIMTMYRRTAFESPEDVTKKLSILLRQLIDICFCLALFYAFVVGTNMAAKKKTSALNWMPIILSIVISIMQGYRSDMLRLWIAVLVVFYTQRKRSIGWKNTKETKYLIRRMALSILLIAVLFVLLRSIVGRLATDWDPLYYVTFYAGSPIAALDLFLKKPLQLSNIWGKETFYYLNQSIGAWFKIPELRYRFPKEFRSSPNGVYLGNVYTAFRAPLADFGYEGMIVLTLIMGFFFTFFYYFVRKQPRKNGVDLGLLIYSYVAYTFFMYFYNNYYSFISFNFVKLIICIIMIRWFMMKSSIRRRTID